LRQVDETPEEYSIAPRVPGLVDADPPDKYLEASASDRTRRYHAFQKPALAFWQWGKYLLIKDNILPAASAQYPGQIEALRPDGHKIVLDYEAVAQQDDPDGNHIGYLVTLTDDCVERATAQWVFQDDPTAYEPFGNWETESGIQRTIIRPFVKLRGDPKRTFLYIMHSGFGGLQFPDTNYSVLPRTFGISIESDAINVDSFWVYPMPPYISSLGAFQQEKAVPAKKLIEGHLRYMGAALVMQEDPTDNCMKITMIPVRAFNPLTARGTITDADFFASDFYTPGTLDDKQSTWQFLTDWHGQKFLQDTIMHDADVIDAKAGAQDAPVKLELRGVNIVFRGSEYLVSAYQMLRWRYGKDRRLFTGAISYDKAKDMSVGQVVTLSLTKGLAADGTAPYAGYAQIIAKGKAVIGKKTPVVLLGDTTKFSGYAPEARVSAIVSPTVLDTTAHLFTSPSNPMKDIGFFLEDYTTVPAGGIPVECVHLANESANTFNTITVVDTATGRVTFSGAHGLAVSDRIRPRDWDNTATHLKAFTHLSEDFKLGAADDPPFVYA